MVSKRGKKKKTLKKRKRKKTKKKKKIVKKQKKKKIVKKTIKKKQKQQQQQKKSKKKKIIKKGKTKKTQNFFGFINKFIDFVRNLKTRPKNLEIKKKEEGVEKEKEEYVDIFEILNEKRIEGKKKENSTSNTLPVIKELLNDGEFPQLDDDARLEITKAISEVKMQNIRKNIYDDKSAEEGIKSFMNNLPTITESLQDLEIKKEDEEIDANRKEFRERLRGAVNRINENKKIK